LKDESDDAPDCGDREVVGLHWLLAGELQPSSFCEAITTGSADTGEGKSAWTKLPSFLGALAISDWASTAAGAQA